MNTFVRIAVMVILVAIPACLPAADKVVVIPLATSQHGNGELFLSAPSFRAVTPMLGSSWEEDGMILNPSGAGSWIAPLDLPVGITITSLELYWKNNSQTAGVTTVTLYLFNLENGNGLDFINMTSNSTELGVQHVRTNTFSFQTTENYQVAVRVYLGHTDKWLMGVKVRYSY